jgi:hypothetical protein
VEKKYKMFASKMRDDLYKNLKLLSAAEDRSIRELLEEAVVEYLERRQFSKEERQGEKSRTMLRVSFTPTKDK